MNLSYLDEPYKSKWIEILSENKENKGEIIIRFGDYPQLRKSYGRTYQCFLCSEYVLNHVQVHRYTYLEKINICIDCYQKYMRTTDFSKVGWNIEEYDRLLEKYGYHYIILMKDKEGIYILEKEVIK